MWSLILQKVKKKKTSQYGLAIIIAGFGFILVWYLMGQDLDFLY